MKLKHYKAVYEDGNYEIINAESNKKALEIATHGSLEHGIFNLYQINVAYEIIKTIL